MRVVPIPGEQLHALVAEASHSEAQARALVRVVLPTLHAIVTASVAEAVELVEGPLAVALRDEILREVVGRVLLPSLLLQWRSIPGDRAWHFLESWTLALVGRLRDRVWVLRAVEAGDSRARTALLERLKRLFERAARRRRLTPHDLEDARQSFFVWLLDDNWRAVQRWDPEGGRAFESWFFARALNQIDTWRRVAPHSEPEPDAEEASEDLERLMARRQLAEIEAWLRTRCTARQLEIFIRRFVHEQSATEIAAALEMQPAAVHMAVSRLRQALVLAFDE